MRSTGLLAIALVLAACSEDAPGTVDDSTAAAAADSSPATATVARPSGWDDTAGPVLLVAGDAPEHVLVVFPGIQGEAVLDTVDASQYAGRSAVLVSRAGTVATVSLADAPQPDAESMACAAWPALAAPPGTAPWTVGFVDGTSAAVALDSLHGLASRDSARLVADVARLASGAPRVSGGDAGAFDGLPFEVRDARRFAHGGREFLAAQVVRRVNQEASPREEHTLLLAERAADGGAWETAYTDRVVGSEESVPRHELLAALLVRDEPALVLAHEGGDGATYSILHRSAAGWRTRWRSAHTRC